MRLVSRSVLSAACLLTLAACERRGGAPAEDGGRDAGERVGTTTTTGAEHRELANELAVARIVAARCLHETDCGNVGSGQRFADYAACSLELHTAVMDDLEATSCAHGIGPEAFEPCMDAVRRERCDDPVGTAARREACAAGELCASATSAPPAR